MSEVRQPRIPMPVIVWTGAAACVVGFVVEHMATQFDRPRFVDSAVLVVATTVIALALHASRRVSFAEGVGVCSLIVLVFLAGLMPCAAVVLMGFAATAIGDLMLGTRSDHRLLIALPIGLGVMAAAVGWLTPLPIHSRPLYALVSVVLVLLRRRALATILANAWHGLRSSAAASPGAAGFALLATSLALTGTWLPTMQSDDLGYHLGLPSRLLADGYYAPDVAQQIWALAPWLGDAVQAIAQLLAGQEARGPVDALWLACAAAALHTLSGALGAGPRVRWLAVATFASLPTLALLCAGMQTELPATAILITLVLLIVTSQRDGSIFAITALVAGLVALKFGQVVAAIVVLAWIALRQRGLPTRRAWAALPVFFVLAGSSYFHAWSASGNPMLPLFNDVFQSAVMAPRQLFDAHWHAGFTAALPWSITFDTHRYLEARDGGFGFIIIAFSGAWIAALIDTRTRAVAIVATAIALLPLLPMQYARYAFPGMALAIAPLFVAGERALGTRRFGALAIAVCVLDLAFQANGGWSLETVQRRRIVMSAGRPEAVLRVFAPERLLIDEIRVRDDSDSVVLALDPRVPNVAELGRRGRSVAWYAPALERARIEADLDESGRGWQTLIASTQARWLLLRPDDLTSAQRAGIALSSAQRVTSIGAAELWSVAARPAAVTLP